MTDPIHGSPFLAALHRRICDRIALGWLRGWLQQNGQLEATIVSGWPVLRLVINWPADGSVTANLVRDHYRLAAADGKAMGPFYDLARTLDVV